MSRTWHSDVPPPAAPPLTAAGRLRAALRITLALALLLPGLGLLLLLRAAERPFAGDRRPLSGAVPRWVMRGLLVVLGLRCRHEGRPLAGGGSIVANHASWLDILALNAGGRATFVSKHEVAGWPGIGWLARAAGTVFIRRDPREASAQIDELRRQMAAGHTIVIFPEGTSTDGRRVLPFRPTLFAAMTAPPRPVQPVTVVYHAPRGADPRLYGWWGDMGFGAHALAVLAAPRQGRIEVIYHPPIDPAAFPNRRTVSDAAERTVRAGLTARLAAPGAGAGTATAPLRSGS